VSSLPAAHLTVEVRRDLDFRPEDAASLADLLDCAAADVRCGIGRRAVFDDACDDLSARRLDQTFELVQMLLGRRARNGS